MGTGSPVLRVHPDDNVAVALRDLTEGDRVQVGQGGLTVREAVLRGHKVALMAVQEGGPFIKYGRPIGRASTDVEAGQWVHEHNLRSDLGRLEDLEYRPELEHLTRDLSGTTFLGYRRGDGGVGTRNELWVVPTVGCVNSLAEELVRRVRAEGLPDGVDGAYALTHACGCSQLGQDLDRTRRLLAALVRHPNAGGVLVLGLGCENNDVPSFQEAVGPVDPDRVRFLVAQEVEDDVDAGQRALRALAEAAGCARRKSVPASEFVLGVKCGGSDAFSGITANPLVGQVADAVVAMGGRTLLSEVPEVFGAEQALAARCVTEHVFDRFVAMVREFREYYRRHGHAAAENPSPGNRAGGITTLEEKALGSVQKGGESPVVAVLDYGESVGERGLSLLAAPGNDLVSTTALAAAGAQLILFTTGRGTPLGGPVPTLKVSSHTALARRKPHWIDFDAGPLLEGEGTSEAARRLLEQLLEVASGRARTRNEINGCRQIALWKSGVTL
ncbi:MAG: altronate dehydratase family protein [Candidatus Brocadiaceae bacterium]